MACEGWRTAQKEEVLQEGQTQDLGGECLYFI